MSNSHIAIIGSGNVGSTIAFACIAKGIGSRISLIDVNEDKVEGEVMDLAQGVFFTDIASVEVGSYEEVAQADILIITAGAAQAPGEKRLELAEKNIEIFKAIFQDLKEVSPHTKIIVVTNPVDVLTTLTQELSGLPQHQVFGSGTCLDTSRFRYYLGKIFDTNAKSIHAYILGEHGDTEFPCLSKANIAGVNITDHKNYDESLVSSAYYKTKNAAYEIIQQKGSTTYAISLAVCEILEAIIYDKSLILPVSVRVPRDLQVKYKLPNICLGLPAKIGKNGIEDVIDLDFTEDEKVKLYKSASTIASYL